MAKHIMRYVSGKRGVAAFVALMCASTLAEGPALQERLEERARLQAELEGAKAELASSREGRTLNQRRRVVELTDSEKALDLDSFAGFRFGAELSDLEVASRHTLNMPFRAFTRVQLMRTDFAHRLYCVRLTGDIGDWSAQSVSNEVAFLRGMLSDQYGISSWQTDVVSGRGAKTVSKFENGNVSISLSANAKWLSLEVTSRRVLAEYERAREDTKARVVEFPDSQGFAELERIAVEASKSFYEKPSIPSGEFGDNGILPSNTETWQGSAANNAGKASFYLPCRSASAGNRGHLYWRKIAISPDGRILSIGEEEKDMRTKYYANP